MPKDLQAGVLYVSEEFFTAAHLCACGCGTKIRTPLGPTEWSVEEDPQGPTLWPSVGNWQQACRSHYWFHNGEVVWGDAWSPAQIARWSCAGAGASAGLLRRALPREQVAKTLELVRATH